MYKSLGSTISVEAIKQVIHKLDLMSRPYVVFMHRKTQKLSKSLIRRLKIRQLYSLFHLWKKEKQS